MPHFIIVFVLLLSTVFSTPAFAQKLAPHWQDRRDYTVDLAERACKGDTNAAVQVRRLFRSNDVVMLNSAAWLRSECSDFSNLTEEKVAEMQKISAEGGYPIGLSNYGSRLITGLGVSKDVEFGIDLKELAAEEGFATSAYELAQYFARGKHVPKQHNIARAYLEQARTGGVSPKRISSLAREISKITNPNGRPPWMAIATSLNGDGTGTGGVAVDQATENVARLAAMKQCKENGGKNCVLKQAIQSTSCTGYVFKHNSRDSYGFITGSRNRSAGISSLLKLCHKERVSGRCTEPYIACSVELYK